MDDERVTRILEHWFIGEPALFQAVMAMPDVVPNRDMACAVRSGQRRLEYNPDLIADVSDADLESLIKAEAVRILLRHPFERKPEGCCRQAVAVGSNLTVSDNYRGSITQLESPADFGLAEGLPYEWYSRRIQEMLPEEQGGSASASAGGMSQQLAENAAANGDTSALWDDDEVMCQQIAGIIDNCRNWGSLPGKFVEMLKASTRPKVNWRNVMNGFKASIQSEHRSLTRMRPNRRYGFEQMGVRHTYSSRLLVAVDTSGSVSSESLSYFYGVINSAFRSGFEVDVVQFDADLKGEPVRLRKAGAEVQVFGRGGTCFQPVIELMNDRNARYDGLVILTDGYAPDPQLPASRRYRILWVLNGEDSYKENSERLSKYGRVIKLELK